MGYGQCDIRSFKFCKLSGLRGEYDGFIKTFFLEKEDGNIVLGLNIDVIDNSGFLPEAIANFDVDFNEDEINFHMHNDFLEKGAKELIVNFNKDVVNLTIFHPDHPEFSKGIDRCNLLSLFSKGCWLNRDWHYVNGTFLYGNCLKR